MKLDYLEFGEKGKNIVFLHGWQQNKKSFTSLVPFLFKKSHLYLLDLPGFGESEFPPENFNSFDYAKEVTAWIKSKKLNNVVLVGHSFGGKIAAIVAKNNSILINKLILIASSGITKKERYHLFKNNLPGFIKNFLRPLLTGRDYKQAGKLLFIFKNVVKEDIADIFKEIKTPTLIVWGKNDKELTVKNGEKINFLIKNSQLNIVEGGHFPFWDNPGKIAELINNFIWKK